MPEAFEFQNTDLDKLRAKLAAGPPAPQFTLPASRFLKKQETKAGRRGIKKLIRPENAAAFVDKFPAPGERLHALLCGDFVLGDAIPAILDKFGPASGPAHIATLSLSAANAHTLAAEIRAGRLGPLTLVASHYFRGVDRATTFAQVKAILAGLCPLVITRSHAKVISIPAGRGHYVIEGSANLRSSDNLEQVSVFNCPQLAAFHGGWIEALRAQSGEGAVA